MKEREHSEFDILGKIQAERMKRNWTEYQLSKNSVLHSPPFQAGIGMTASRL